MILLPFLLPTVFFLKEGNDDLEDKSTSDLVSFVRAELNMTPVFVTLETTCTDNVYMLVDRDEYMLHVTIPFHKTMYQKYNMIEECDSNGQDWLSMNFSDTHDVIEFFESYELVLPTNVLFVYDEMHTSDTEELMRYILDNYAFENHRKNCIDKAYGFLRLKKLYDLVDLRSDTVLPWYKYDKKDEQKGTGHARDLFSNILKDIDTKVMQDVLWRVVSNYTVIE
jgi:hypothetical protein